MSFFAPRAVLIGGLAFAVAAGGAQAASAPAKPVAAPAVPAPSADDPSVVSGEFWGDWNKTKSSAEFAALKAAVGGDKSNAPPAAPQAGPEKQRIVDIAIAKPEQAAKVLSAAAASNDTASANALATVVNMTTSPQMREEAAPLVAPEAQAQVASFTANLSTGIEGLPGIYLGDNASVNGGERAAAPSGYTPVAGGSSGCPGR